MKDSDIIEKALQSLNEHGKRVTGCARGCLLYIIAIIVYIILFVAIGIN